MSRIAKKPIKIPEKTEVTVNGVTVTVKGPAGEIKKDFRPDVKFEVANGEITVTLVGKASDSFPLWGTYTSHIKNMLAGVNTPYQKKLIIEGIGFKADVKGKDLALALGFSHPVNVPIPADLKVVTEKNNIVVTGIDKEKVGQFAAMIRSLKKPEPYKGKGIRFDNEVIRRKQGKKSV